MSAPPGRALASSRPGSRTYDRLVSIAVTVGVIVAFLVGLALGVTVVAARHRTGRPQPVGAALGPDRSPQRATQPLASLVVEALDHGVAVVDRDEFVVLVNPAARAM